jgi:hypothetical protein
MAFADDATVPPVGQRLPWIEAQNAAIIEGNKNFERRKGGG